MIDPTQLGALSSLHGLMMQLAERTPEASFSRQFHPELGSFAHILGESVYRELYWIRDVILGDNDLAQRVEHLFKPGAQSLAQQCAQLPPKDHLLNWAAEIHDHHLMLLANPAMLPPHPLLEESAIIHFIVQEHARSYERIIALLNLEQLEAESFDYTATNILESRSPGGEGIDVTQGVYRIGPREDPRAYDNELPPQVVELSKYKIALHPVSNAEYLAFIEDGGYGNNNYWPENAHAWLKAESKGAPQHWRKDRKGHWFGIGINGPLDLIPDDPVHGLSHYEALAYAAWVADQGGETAGAVLQHEYQWETAARTQAISDFGRVWEWCANPFAPYNEYQRPDSSHYATPDFDGHHFTIRGGCLHTQPVLRRITFRNRAMPHWNFQFAGARLVFPPSKDFWT